MKLNKSKYAQMNPVMGIVTIAVALLVAVIVISLNSTILSEIRNTADNDIASLPNNESLTWPGNNTVLYLTQGDAIVGTEKVWNATTLLVRGTHYNLDSSSITFTNKTGWMHFLTSKLNISYSYYYGSYARNVTSYGINGQVTFSQFVPTIAIIAISAIIIGIVLVMFGRKAD